MPLSHANGFCAGLILALPLAAHAQWIPTNGPTGPIIEELATDGSSLFAETVSYGFVRSRDHGESWRGLGKPINAPVLSYSMIARGDTLYVGNENGVQIHDGEGATWRRANTGLGEDTSVHSLAFGWGGLLAVTLTGSLYRSLDQGGHWARMDSGGGRSFMTGIAPVLAFDGDCVYMAGNPDVRRSLDRGRTWSRLRPDPKDTVVSTVISRPPYVFALTGMAVYRSRDSGATWTKLALGAREDSTGFRSLDAVGSRLYAAQNMTGVFSSADAGETWTREPGIFESQYVEVVSGIVGLGEEIFAGTNLGVYRSSDFGHTWSGTNTGIGESDTRNLAAEGSGLLTALRRPFAFVSDDQGRQWRFLSPPGNVEDVKGVQGILYALSNDSGIFRSRDGGTAWESFLPASGTVSQYPYSRFFILGQDIYDFGLRPTGPFLRLVSPLRAGQTVIPVWPGGPVTDLALCAGIPFAIVSDSLLSYDASARLWRLLQSPYPRSMGVLGSQGSAVLLGTYYGGLFRSADSGATWKKVIDHAEYGSIWSLLEVGGSVFAGTDSGVAVSRNGVAWGKLNQGFETGLPGSTQVYELAAQDGNLYAGKDSGVWRIPVDSTGSGIVPHLTAGPRKPAARWTLVSGNVGFKGDPGEARRDARGRALAEPRTAAHPHP